MLRLRYKGYSRANGITSGNCGFRCVIYKPAKSEKRGKKFDDSALELRFSAA